MPSYLITGASRGIGLELVTQLTQEPSNIVIGLVRNAASSEQLHQLKAQRPNVHIVEADIVDVFAIQRAVDEVAKVTNGSLDVLINNAALIGQKHGHLTLDQFPDPSVLEEDLTEHFRTNVIGIIHTINAFLPLLKKGNHKKVITISTAIGDPDFTLATKFVTSGPYSISKAAVNMVNVKYAVQYAKEGFIFVAMSPGLVDTNTSNVPPTPEQLEAYMKAVDSFRLVYPDIKGAFTPQQSVTSQLKAIEAMTAEDNGAFVSQNGTKDWFGLLL